MSSSNRERIERWSNGDHPAAAEVVATYERRLTALAEKMISPKLARRVDPADVVNSAWTKFFLATREGKLHVPESDDLWPLLAKLVARNVARQAEILKAAKRNPLREESVDPGTIGEPEGVSSHSESLNRIFESLSERDSKILEQMAAGWEHSEIARELNCSERTVRRVIHRLRSDGQDRDPERRVGYHEVLLLEFIARGGVAKVYRARLVRENQPVVVKFLHRSLWSYGGAVQAMLEEARIAGTLRHPNLVNLLGWGTTRPGGLFLVYDWVEGVTA